MQEFQDTTEISGYSGQILKFQDNTQAWEWSRKLSDGKEQKI